MSCKSGFLRLHRRNCASTRLMAQCWEQYSNICKQEGNLRAIVCVLILHWYGNSSTVEVRGGVLCRPGWFPSIAADFLHDCIEKYSRSYMLGFLVATWVKNKHSNGSWNGSTGLFNGRIHIIGAKCAIHVLEGNPQHLNRRAP